MAVVIVGASVAGIRAAQALRAGGFDAEIVVLGEERHHPYDKPPLSKELLAPEASGEPVPLVERAKLDELALDLRLGVKASSLDVDRRLVTTAKGHQIDFDHLVVATGVRPRNLPGAEAVDGVYTLRNADDARALRAELDRASRVVVIGAGFIGAEFASAARARGLDVTLVEAQSTPMAHLLGEEVGTKLAAVHALNGVDVRPGVGVTGLVGDVRVTGVSLSSGEVVPADLVVVGVGAVPATEWLEGSGLPIDNGVCCGSDLRVHGTDNIYAAGDVARFRHPLYPSDVRIEHWTSANEHAAIVAAGILGRPAPTMQVPYVWSDQYGRRIQIVGRPADGTARVVHGGVEHPAAPLLAIYANDSGVVVGGLTVDSPRILMKLRKAITGRVDVDLLDIGLAVGA